MSLICCLALALGNIILNPEFAGDGLGGFLNWDKYSSPEGARPGAGHDGHAALRLTSGRPFTLEQQGLRLIAGEDYAFGVWVRARGAGSKVQALVWNSWWDADVRSAFSPSDTDGRWVKVEFRGKMVPSKSKRYSMGIRGEVGADAEVEISDPFLIPLSEAAAKATLPDPALPRRARIVPVSPRLACVDAETGDMEFRWPGVFPKAADGYRLKVSVDGAEKAVAPVGADGRATVRLGSLAEGEHELVVRLVAAADGAVLAEDNYRIRARRFPQPDRRARRLNNLVTEIFSEAAENREYAFVRPTDGWTYIGLDRDEPTAEVALDGTNVVRFRSGERNETMRYLEAGEHRLSVRGTTGGRLSVRAVKTILLLGPTTSPTGTCYAANTYRLDFVNRFCGNFYNTPVRYNWSRMKKDGTEDPDVRWFESRGLRVTSEFCTTLSAFTGKCVDDLYGQFARQKAYADGFDLTVDEMGINIGRGTHYLLAESIWKFNRERPSQAASVYYFDALNRHFDDERAQTSEIAAIVNSGGGRGFVLSETYPCALYGEKKTYAKEENFREFMDSARRYVPAAAEGVIFVFSGYVVPEGWNTWANPAADMKAQFGHFIHRIAVDPAFADVGGLGFTAFHRADEELVRFYAQITRHYAIEGRSDDFAARHGLRYLPGLLANGDFDKGAEGWRTFPAEEGSLAPRVVKGYGKSCEGRQGVPKGTGDKVMAFRRPASGANRLEQTLKLERGKVYVLSYYTTDLEDVGRKDVTEKTAKTVGLKASLADADVFRGLSYDRRWKRSMTQRVVFRARADEVTLAFSDGRDGSSSAAEPGRVTLLNYIKLSPYYHESEQDLRDLDAL